MKPADEKKAVLRLAKWLLKQADGITVALSAQLESMDRFDISVQEPENPHFKAKQIVFRLQAK